MTTFEALRVLDYNGISHCYVLDTTGAAPWNTFLGDVRVFSREAISNDAVQFTPNGLANNWQNAALVPPVPGTDYNGSPTVGQQDTYVVQDVPSNLGVIYGASVIALMNKSDAGGRSMAAVLKSTATTSVGANIAIATSPIVTRQMYQTDPATGVQWVLAGMQGGKLKVGAKVTV